MKFLSYEIIPSLRRCRRLRAETGSCEALGPQPVLCGGLDGRYRGFSLLPLGFIAAADVMHHFPFAGLQTLGPVLTC